jgi:DNA-3-methyladenine glycosylase I
MAAKVECCWGEVSPLMRRYHDTEWGVPLHDDRKHFEFIVLDGMQAGLSWAIVLNKREGFRKAFAGFDPRVARFTKRDVQRLLADPEIVRNRLKVEAAVGNARQFLEVQGEFGTFDAFVWQFVGGKPIRNRWRSLTELPATSAESDAMSAELKRRAFKFVGSTICYAYMQAAGMVNDHLVHCVRHKACG